MDRCCQGKKEDEPGLVDGEKDMDAIDDDAAKVRKRTNRDSWPDAAKVRKRTSRELWVEWMTWTLLTMMLPR